MSRFSGAWVGLKTTAELRECSTSIRDRSVAMPVQTPTEAVPPRGSVHLRWPDPWHESEVRWLEGRLPAVHAFARANGIDRTVIGTRHASLGIVTAGKSYRDLLQALDDLHIELTELESLGVAIYKVGMTWPLERQRLLEFAARCEEVLVIEEKRPFIEDQVRSILYDLSERPLVTGKMDRRGEWQFPWIGEFG